MLFFRVLSAIAYWFWYLIISVSPLLSLLSLPLSPTPIVSPLASLSFSLVRRHDVCFLSLFCSFPFADRSSRNEYLFYALAMAVIRSRMKSIFMNKAFNSRSDADETNIDVPTDTVVDSGSKPLSRCFPSRSLYKVRGRAHISIARESINSLAEDD